MNSKFLRKQMICGLMAALMVGAWALPASAQTAAASDAASTSVTSEVTGTTDEAQTTTDIEEPTVPEQTVVSVKEPEIRVDLTKSIVFYRAVGGESIGSLEAQTIYVERTETDAKGQKWGQVHTWLGYVWVRL